MKLHEWVSLERGRQTLLARKVDAQPQLVWQWADGRRQVPPERRPSIEAATNGEVRCEDMGADVVWHRVADPNWPWHQEGRPTMDVTQKGA